VVTVNSVLLGGKMYSLAQQSPECTPNYLCNCRSFFQSVCLLGYCVFPLVIAAFLLLIPGLNTLMIARGIIVAICFVWATACTLLVILFVLCRPNCFDQLQLDFLLAWYHPTAKHSRRILFSCFIWCCVRLLAGLVPMKLTALPCSLDDSSIIKQYQWIGFHCL